MDLEGGIDAPDTPESLGIAISSADFRGLVEKYLDRMRANDENGATDYITMTRLWNTIEQGRLGETDDLFRHYQTAFFPAYVQRVKEALDADVTKGMALYSKGHDLYLGGKPHHNSSYQVRS